MSVLLAWPSMAWTTSPLVRGSAALTHAASPDEDTALCGARSPFHGDPWPARGDPWPALYSRCPSCARCLYDRGCA
jgi:hypothetical protein